MPFGLVSAPATFARMMRAVLAASAISFFDDILVVSLLVGGTLERRPRCADQSTRCRADNQTFQDLRWFPEAGVSRSYAWSRWFATRGEEGSEDFVDCNTNDEETGESSVGNRGLLPKIRSESGVSDGTNFGSAFR